MNQINKIYINGEFVTPRGTETFDLINPVTNQKPEKWFWEMKKIPEWPLQQQRKFSTFQKQQRKKGSIFSENYTML